MKRLRDGILVFLCCCVYNCAFADCPGCYLEGKIVKENHRYGTFVTALDLMTKRGVKTIVETGTARRGTSNCAGDGCSTPIFAQWAKDHGAVLYSVDINPDAIQQAAQAVSGAEKMSDLLPVIPLSSCIISKIK